jgi:membrane protease YdiL (CAAX protease family)
VFTLYIPWDFALVLVFLAVFVPWRGAARMKRLLSKPETTARERLSLYASTIIFQWLLAIFIFLLCGLRTVSFEELGIATENPWRIAWTSIAITGILCATQVIGLRKMAQLPEEKRGSLFAITERIMPRTAKETALYTALACTAGISEEFLYRGFVFMAFVRMIVNYGPPTGLAAILSAGWFSLAHLYQGRRGIITTFVVGMIFAGLRIWTGSLIPPIFAHIGIDLTIGICASRLFRRG